MFAPWFQKYLRTVILYLEVLSLRSISVNDSISYSFSAFEFDGDLFHLVRVAFLLHQVLVPPAVVHSSLLGFCCDSYGVLYHLRSFT